MMKKWLIPAALSVAVVSLSSLLMAGGDGKTLYVDKGCNACHGNDGNSPIMAAYPKIAGQNKDYLIAQIKDIRDEKRTNGQSGIMQATIKELNDEDIKAISSWLSGL